MIFEQKTLGQLSKNGRGYYGIGASAVPFSNELYTYLRITDIRDDGTLNSADLKSVADPEASKYLLVPNDIVFARTGASTGRNYFYDGRDGTFVYAGFLIKFSIDDSLVNPRYIKHYCRSKKYWDWISAYNTGSTRGNINAQTLASLPIMLPPREYQDRVVSILDALDCKIVLNDRINKNLQQQAFAIFSKLLQNKQSGYISLSSIADLNPKRVLNKNTLARYIDMSRLSTSESFPDGWEVKPYNGGMKFCNGDTILARITPCLENGKAAFINFLEDGEYAFGSTEYIIICPKANFPPEFFYCLARYPSFVEYAVKNMNGTSGRQRVSADILGKFSLPLLGKDEIDYFSNVVPELFTLINKNSIENLYLKELRNILLQKLLSGVLDIIDTHP